MAVWEVRVVYSYGDRSWENVWKIDVGELTDVPSGTILAIATFAASSLLSLYSVERIVRRPAGSRDAFIETVVGVAGEIGIGGNLALPLYNTVRILLQSGAGRPGLKYLRGFLTDASIADELNHINAGQITTLTGLLNDLLNQASDDGVSFVEGSANTPIISAVPQTLIAMRQLHRKRRRTV